MGHIRSGKKVIAQHMNFYHTVNGVFKIPINETVSTVTIFVAQILLLIGSRHIGQKRNSDREI